MNCINKYTNKMGCGGISDNHRNYNRIYIGLTYSNWWLYIFFWGVVVILVNEYIIYICIHNINVDPSRHRLSHCDLER